MSMKVCYFKRNFATRTSNCIHLTVLRSLTTCRTQSNDEGVIWGDEVPVNTTYKPWQLDSDNFQLRRCKCGDTNSSEQPRCRHRRLDRSYELLHFDTAVGLISKHEWCAFSLLGYCACYSFIKLLKIKKKRNIVLGWSLIGANCM